MGTFFLTIGTLEVYQYCTTCENSIQTEICYTVKRNLLEPYIEQ